MRFHEPLIFRRAWGLVVDGAHKRVEDDLAVKVTERDLDDLDGGADTHRLSVNNESAGVELDGFERRGVRLLQVIQHGAILYPEGSRQERAK